MIVKCPVPGCSRLHPASYLMCPQHWRKVPAELKTAVWLHYRQGQEKEGWAGATDAYRQAAFAAIESAQDRGPSGGLPLDS